VVFDDEVAQEIAELTAEYRAELPAKAKTIAAAIAARDRTTAAAIAHRLHGTAGSYGFAEVSAVGGEIEDALASDAPDWAAVDALLHKLTAAANR